MKRHTGRVFAAPAWLVAVAALNMCVTSPVVAQSLVPVHKAIAVPGVIDFETIDQGQFSYFRCGDSCYKGMDMLIKDQGTWEWFWARHTMGIEPPPPLPEVDFDAEMVMVTILGFQTTGGGPSIEVLEVDVNTQSLRVLVEDDDTPGPLCVITNPFHIIRLGTVQVPSVVFEHQKP